MVDVDLEHLDRKERILGWEGLGGSINPGQSVKWRYSWGSYHGAEVVSARPLNAGSELQISSQGQKLEPDGSYTYYATVRNLGPLPVRYRLTGGVV